VQTPTNRLSALERGHLLAVANSDEFANLPPSQIVPRLVDRENIAPDQVVLHSDNGSPMKGVTMLATLQALGVMPSFSRPSVSNDNLWCSTSTVARSLGMKCM
jgi:hypothetical protein